MGSRLCDEKAIRTLPAIPPSVARVLQIPSSKKEEPRLQARFFLLMVEVRGFEPLTSCMPCKRSTN